MIKLSEISRKILRAIYRGVGVAGISLAATSCPIFVAMYGPGPDIYSEEVNILGKIISQKTGEPISGIAVYVRYLNYFTTSSFDGQFNFWLPRHNNYTFIFTDIDADENGGHFRQHTVRLTREEAEALAETPLVIELEEADAE
jgi:hypothetical protein